MNDLENLIDINKTRGLPRSYRFNPFIRWFTITIALLIIIYALWFIFTKIYSDSSNFHKFLPFALMFLGLNSLIRNILLLNKITFHQSYISFHFIARKSVVIEWESMRKMELNDSKHKMIRLRYLKNDTEKNFEFQLNFPHMLEIVNSIAEMCPQLEYDEFLSRVVISQEEKNAYRQRQTELSE